MKGGPSMLYETVRLSVPGAEEAAELTKIIVEAIE